MRKLIHSVSLTLSWFLILALLFAFTDGLQANAGLTGDLDSLNSQMSDVQSRIVELQSEIDSLDYQRQSVMEKKAVLDEKNRLAQEELDIIQEQIDIIDNYLANRQADLEAARAQEEAQEEAWMARLRAMEENSGLSYIQVLFDATSFSDLLTRIDFVTELNEYDEELFNAYLASRQTVEELEAEAEEMSAANEANRALYEEKKAQLDADIASACQMIADIEADMEGYQELLAEQNAAEEALSAEIAAKLSEYYAAQISAEEVQEAVQEAREDNTEGDSDGDSEGGTEGGTAATYSGDGTTLLWPSWSQWVSSYYGLRESPGGIGSTDHKGIDITGTDISGTDVWSAASGTVIAAGTDDGYGNYVVVAMDNGYTARYSHLTDTYVSEGETVSQGESVGTVGSTGISTGAHLDFRITDSDGNYVDPMSFEYTYAD